jgi:hypothetical protein
MRILICTHGRSGGMGLLAWITREMEYGYGSYHEPDIINNKDLLEEINGRNNCIVKIFPYWIKWGGVDLDKFVDSFDKVICHKRENTREMAISMAYSEVESLKVLKEGGVIDCHQTYKIDDQWIEDHESRIQEIMEDDRLTNCGLNLIKREDALHTTYERIFDGKEDVERIIEYLGIKNSKHTYTLDKKYRLRNGELGMSNFKSTEVHIKKDFSKFI